jgi:thioesterase domain-containing protein
VLGLRELAQGLPEEQTVIGLDIEATPLHVRYSLESVTDHFLEEIRRQFPEGPYDFFGFSSGGVYAYELASRLGAEAGRIIMLDTFAPGYQRAEGGSRVGEWTRKLRTYSQIARKASAQELKELVSMRLSRGFGPPPPTLDLWLLSQYYAQPVSTPARYEGKLHVVRFSFQPRFHTDPSLGWSKRASQIELHETLGTHGAMSLQRPVVVETARLVSRLLLDDRP